MAKIFLLLVLLLLLTPSTAADHLISASAAPPTASSIRSVEPSFAVVVIALTMGFSLIGFLIICFRHCEHQLDLVNSRYYFTAPPPVAARRGLDPSVIDSFPICTFSETIKNRDESLECCAVCINDFVDGDKLRLLPLCSHVFHPRCIDVWLVYNSTCPICRSKTTTAGGGLARASPSDSPGRVPVVNSDERVDSGEQYRSETGRNPARSVEKFSTSDEVRIQVLDESVGYPRLAVGPVLS